MTLTVTIPTLETDRLILRAPQISDAEHFMAFMASDRAQYVGGLIVNIWRHNKGMLPE